MTSVEAGNVDLHELHSSGLAPVKNGLVVYGLTTLIVAVGIHWGTMVFSQSESQRRVVLIGSTLRDALTQWDGQWYVGIVDNGYFYDPNRMSPVAFFPLYPLLGSVLAKLTGVPADVALLLVSNLMLIAAFALLFAYVRRRYPDAPKELAIYGVLAFALFPTTLFARMVYTESLFIFLSILVLYGMQRKWPLIVLALLVGLTTAARSVGIVLILPLFLNAWDRSRSFWKSLGQLVYLGPISVWGLAAYMLYLGLTFGEPLAFASAQEHWQFMPRITAGEHLLSLVAWEPLWTVYVPSSPAFHERWGANPSTLCSLQFANPIYFVGAGILLYLGAFKRWLSRDEILLGIGLLVMTYFFRGYEMCMASQGRFVSAVFPIYLVLGNLLLRLPLVVSTGVLGVFAWFLAIYSAMFAAEYLFI